MSPFTQREAPKSVEERAPGGPGFRGVPEPSKKLSQVRQFWFRH
ncbi:hypothetical protein E2C01_091716 [Portunus trituberculatus]|uniref:Uncharacterized protein n=1 Tax=Portunus trituberculatus TaxID=210409 RepID=A0A5B7JTL2_PORTR|nr:hypothetical protein [Portunus trituberculatus]